MHEALTLSEPEAIMRPPVRTSHDMRAGLTNRTAPKVELLRSPGSPLHTLLAIESSGDWPARLPDYRRELLRYVAALRGDAAERAACQDELKALLEDELGGLLASRDIAERSARRDAFNEMVADTDALAEAMELAAHRLSPARAPNMISFLRAKLIWRANDILESDTRRHSRRVTSAADPLSLATLDQRTVHEAPRTTRRILLRQILETFADGDPTGARILEGLMEGESIAELARRTGRSRQQIYRFLQRIRDWIERTEE